MNYGGAYVASVALHASYPQAVEAILEASAFKGVSVVVAYAPFVSDRKTASSSAASSAVVDFVTSSQSKFTKSLSMLRQSKEAVDEGVWPLYRYNPSVNDPQLAFRLDSKHLRQSLQKFVDRENQFAFYLKQIHDANSSRPNRVEDEAKMLKSLDEQVRQMHS